MTCQFFQRQSSRINPEHRILLGFNFLEGFSKSQDGQLPTQQPVQQILPSLIPCKITFSHCISIFLNLSLIVVLISAIARALRVRTKTVLVLPKAIKDFLIRQLKPLLVTYYSLQIENTSWKVLAYGIYARVVDVSEIERVSAANE